MFTVEQRIWTDFKSLIDNHGIQWKYYESTESYDLFGSDNFVLYKSHIPKDGGADQVDFESNYKPYFNIKFITTQLIDDGYIKLQDGYGNLIGSQAGSLNTVITNTVPVTVGNFPFVQPVSDNNSSITIDGYVDSRLRDGYNSTIGSSGGSLFTQITNTISLPTGAATAANQATEITSLQLLDDLPHLNGDSITSAKGIGVLGSDGTNFRWLKLDSGGSLVVATAPSADTFFSFGDVTTAVIAQSAVRRTTYTEQATNAQRSIASSSANDTSAGTGARTVLITYLDATGAGPFTETVTLNGTSFVNTANSNICFIEKMEVLTVGSTGSNVGTLTLRAATAGGGAIIGTINATDNKTFWAHHYIPTGKSMSVTGLSVNHSGTTVGSGGVFILKAITLPIANQAERQISDFVRLYGQSSTFSRLYNSPITLDGPARVIMYVTPETSSSTVYRGSIDFSEI